MYFVYHADACSLVHAWLFILRHWVSFMIKLKLSDGSEKLAFTFCAQCSARIRLDFFYLSCAAVDIFCWICRKPECLTFTRINCCFSVTSAKKNYFCVCQGISCISRRRGVQLLKRENNVRCYDDSLLWKVFSVNRIACKYQCNLFDRISH